MYEYKSIVISSHSASILEDKLNHELKYIINGEIISITHSNSCNKYKEIYSVVIVYKKEIKAEDIIGEL